ncbi:MAG: serine hydrolase [Gemmatimonadetes bacterium]|nr:serine hydrolase [Gemmatimonadota bacterium]
MLTRSLLLAFAPIVAFTTGASVAQAQLPDSIRTRVDAVFSRWDRTDSPGCALGISQSGREVYARGYGMSDLQHAIAITPSSIFHVASVSKEFAAYSVALLAEEGRLSLDDDVRQHVPEIPNYGQRITVRQLIHHTSGLRDQWQLLGYAGWRFPEDLITEQDVLRMVSRQKGTNFAPGAEWAYSNTGYTLLAVIVKRVSGKSLREFAQERIFAPLGMRDTHLHDDHTMIVRGRTSAYEPRPGGGWKISIPVFDTYGATSLFTTAGDMLKWMANLDAPTVGSRALVAAAQTSSTLNDGTPTSYGYGLSIFKYRGLSAIGHGGADAGYRAQVERYPERGIAIAVLCNAAIATPNVLTRNVLDVLLGASAPRQALSIDTVPRAVSAEIKQRWVGTYRDSVSQAVLRVRLAGDTLTLGDGRPLVITSDTSARIAASANALVLRSSGTTVTGVAQVPHTTRPLIFRREAPFTPDRAALAAYAGAFYSEELDVRYDLRVADSSLVMFHRKLDDSPLAPASRDVFTAAFGATFQFTRDRTGKVNGFTITDGRVRGVRFERMK